MLSDLLGDHQQQMETGIIQENMLDGYYRVSINGTVVTARNQTAGQLAVGAVVSVAATSWGRFVVSTANRHSANIPTITIRG